MIRIDKKKEFEFACRQEFNMKMTFRHKQYMYSDFTQTKRRLELNKALHLLHPVISTLKRNEEFQDYPMMLSNHPAKKQAAFTHVS